MKTKEKPPESIWWLDSSNRLTGDDSVACTDMNLYLQKKTRQQLFLLKPFLALVNHREYPTLIRKLYCHRTSATRVFSGLQRCQYLGEVLALEFIYRHLLLPLRPGFSLRGGHRLRFFLEFCVILFKIDVPIKLLEQLLPR